MVSIKPISAELVRPFAVQPPMEYLSEVKNPSLSASCDSPLPPGLAVGRVGFAKGIGVVVYHRFCQHVRCTAMCNRYSHDESEETA